MSFKIWFDLLARGLNVFHELCFIQFKLLEWENGIREVFFERTSRI